MPQNFKYDTSVARQRSRRDKKREQEQARQRGFYGYQEFDIVPLRDIKPEKVWDERKLNAVLRDIEQGKPLAPIELSPVGNRLEITDGIHRYNASKNLGFTHIPALISHYVEAPELKEELQPNTFKVGDFVEFTEPIEGFRHGYLLEALGGLPGHELFSVVGGNRNKADWIGDIPRSKFDRTIRPASALKETLLNHWYVKDSRTGSLRRDLIDVGAHNPSVRNHIRTLLAFIDS